MTVRQLEAHYDDRAENSTLVSIRGRKGPDGLSEHFEIVDDFLVVCDGTYRVDGMVVHANGTIVVTIKTQPPQENTHG